MEVPSRSESPLLRPDEYMAPPVAVVGGLVPIVEERTIPTLVDSDHTGDKDPIIRREHVDYIVIPDNK